MTPLLYYLLLINAAGLLSMLADKRRARHGRWRIPEKTLLTFAILGGSVGSFAGMHLFHHKTRKPMFSVGLPVLIFLHTLLFLYITKTL